MLRLGLGWFVVCLTPGLLAGAHLPIRTYTTADGLARDHILCIVQDSLSFLWFCTAEGLSRYDGYEFKNYGTSQGLPGNVVTDFLETRTGDHWIATTDGIARFDTRGAGPNRFVRYALGSRKPGGTLLREDSRGGIWCGTRSGEGIFYLAPGGTTFRHVELAMTEHTVTSIAVDRHDALWIGTLDGLYRRDPDSSLRVFSLVEGMPNTSIMALREDHNGLMWVGTRKGLVEMESSGKILRAYSTLDGLPAPRIEAMLETRDGTLWVSTAGGLAEWTPAQPLDGREFRAYSLEQGLTARTVGTLAEDRDGNLWIGTFGSGAMKMARSGFLTFTESDGVPVIASMGETAKGELYITYRQSDGLYLGKFDGRRFISIRPAWPAQLQAFGWSSGQTVVQDRCGEWWMATGHGVYRFARASGMERLAGASPIAVYRKSDGLPGDEIFRLFEDSRQNIWIGTIGPEKSDGIAVWDRATGKIHAFSSADGLPDKPLPSVIAEDRSGDIWLGLYHGGAARYRNGRFTVFGESDGITGLVNGTLSDSAGHFWMATTRGVLRIDDPAAETPRLVSYGTAQGLSSSDINALAEDRWGRIYAATGRGIDRFTPQPGSLGPIQRFTTADGIAPGSLDLAFCDRKGNLWFSTPLGLSRFTPAADRPQSPPPVLVTGVSVGGVSQAVSDLGQPDVGRLSLPQRPLRIDYVGLGFQPGETLRYQYMLEGADHEWSAPSDQRSVIYASLAPGGYRFLVRAVTGNGLSSPHPAGVVFVILPPFWRAWWFLLACGTLAALLIYTFHRYRVAQLLAVANVRTRIATDLHDDIGASLSQIAILSEVAQRDVPRETNNGTPLADIAGISRELVDSMSDIVWAINPDHDRLSNLVYRMRRFATDLLGAHSIALQFRSTVADQDLRVEPAIRRQIFLIFKEAVHNAARHSAATLVEVYLHRDGPQLVLQVSDNGRGFDPTTPSDGHGLNSMRKRAASLCATLEWQSDANKGTVLTVRVLLESAATLSLLRGRFARRFR